MSLMNNTQILQPNLLGLSRIILPWLDGEQSKVASAAEPFDDWLVRTSPTWTWDVPHLVLIRYYLRLIDSGAIKRLMLFLPPRHGKSEQTTIRYPAWRLSQNPEERIIIAAYNQILAEKFSRKTRRFVQADGTLSRERKAVYDWETEQGGGVRAVGVGGGITGQGGNLIVVDDPVKNREEANSQVYRDKVYDWFTDDLYTRLEPGAAIIIIQTRWHEDDLSGRLLQEEKEGNLEGSEPWTVVKIPAEAKEDEPSLPDGVGRKKGEALWPARYPLPALVDLKNRLKGSYYALFQQEPQPEEGTIFKIGYFDRLRHENIPERKTFSYVLSAWDTAFKDKESADYSATVTAGILGNRIYILDAWRERLEFPALNSAIRARWELHRPNWIGIEDKGSGTSAVQTIQAATLLPIVPVSTGGLSKEERARLVSGLCQSGRVVIPATAWGDALLDELIRFPTGAHDDFVDAFVYVLSQVMSGLSAFSIQEY